MDETGKPETGTEVAEATVQEAKAVVQDQYDNMLRSIRTNPLQAVAIAAGVGFILALIARR